MNEDRKELTKASSRDQISVESFSNDNEEKVDGFWAVI